MTFLIYSSSFPCYFSFCLQQLISCRWTASLALPDSERSFLIYWSRLPSRRACLRLSLGISQLISLMCASHPSGSPPFASSASFSRQHSSSYSLILSTRTFSSRMLVNLPTTAATLSCCQFGYGSVSQWTTSRGTCLGWMSFILAAFPLFLMRRALLLYLRVLSVCSQKRASGETHAIITVLELPPSESLRMRVSLESRNGMNTGRFWSARMLMHLPSVSRLLLMLIPSTNRLLSFCPAFSLPARSIRKSLDSLTATSPSPCGRNWRTVNCRMACEREEYSLLVVALWLRRARLSRMAALACWALSMGSSARSLMKTPRTGSSMMLSWCGASESRSLMFSLQISKKESRSWNLQRYSLRTSSKIRYSVSPTTPCPCPCPSPLNIVQVLPAPVMPQMKTVELKPASTFLMGSRMVRSKTCELVAACPKTSSYSQTRSGSVEQQGGSTSTCRLPTMRRQSPRGCALGPGLTRRKILKCSSKAGEGGSWGTLGTCLRGSLCASHFGLLIQIIRCCPFK